MREHFRVGVGSEFAVAIADELIFQSLVIFDDAVVNESQPTARIEMRVRVLVGRLSVRSPAGMTDSVSPSRRPFRHELAQLRDASRALAGFDFIAIDNRDPGGVVAAI